MEIKQLKINGKTYDLVTKSYVDAKTEELIVEYNTPYDAVTNKAATMADIENALLVDEEELV